MHLYNKYEFYSNIMAFKPVQITILQLLPSKYIQKLNKSLYF